MADRTGNSIPQALHHINNAAMLPAYTLMRRELFDAHRLFKDAEEEYSHPIQYIIAIELPRNDPEPSEEIDKLSD